VARRPWSRPWTRPGRACGRAPVCAACRHDPGSFKKAMLRVVSMWLRACQALAMPAPHILPTLQTAQCACG